ncbi:MAG: RluA family pseudouridine synthase [Gammaproteobacteria bacterium]
MGVLQFEGVGAITLYQDDDMVAINKPEGIATIPGYAKEPSLLDILAAHYPHKLFVVHRLDKDVSGVMLFAKNAGAHRYLNDQFSARTVSKTYVAVVHGRCERDGGVIDKPLRPFSSGRMGIDERRGKPSLTRFQVIERLPLHSVLAVWPETGRRHQIRVHCYSIGHPIAGDARYGDKALQARYPRLMLHARSLVVRSPTGAEIALQAPLPPSFERVLATLRDAALAVQSS